MKYFLIAIMLLSVTNSGLVNAKVYKCKGEDGKTVYASEPCDKKSQQEIKTRIKSNQSDLLQSTDSPVGRWVNERKPKMVASLSSGGGFSMTDHDGTPMRGRWSEKNGVYTIDASFLGLDMKIKMRYNAETDTLLLSKPGFVDTLVAYKRRN